MKVVNLEGLEVANDKEIGESFEDYFHLNGIFMLITATSHHPIFPQSYL